MVVETQTLYCIKNTTIVIYENEVCFALEFEDVPSLMEMVQTKLTHGTLVDMPIMEFIMTYGFNNVN